jgi:ADP-ribosylglycohydrolase
VIYGLALGDALGWPVEMLSRPQILAKYGRAGITEPPRPALSTDETQMSAALAEALIEAGEADLDTLMAALTRQFIGWKHNPTTGLRAPGAITMRGLNALERGAPWREAGVKDSKGCGSCIRVAPVGYFYQHAPDQLREIAWAQSLLTHRHPAAEAAAIAAAYVIKLALDATPPNDYLPRLSDFTKGLSEEFDAALRRAQEALAWPDTEAALNHIGPTRGGGWSAEEAVGMALFCVLRHPDDFVSAVTLAANISGDSDSVASLTGGILGARLGLDGLPAQWVVRLENVDYLTQLARRLAAHKERHFPAP